MIRVVAPILLALAAGGAFAAERPRSPLCPDTLPDGAHLPPQPGCAGRERAPARGREDGFVDLGNGTRVRIGGRASAEYGVRR